MGRRSPIEHREAVASLFRETRLSAGLTQEEVAEVLDRPQSYISKVETGETRVDILELRDLLRAIGGTVDEFTGRLERRLRAIGPGTPPQRFGRSRRRR